MSGTAGGKAADKCRVADCQACQPETEVTVKFQVTTAAGVALRRLAGLGNNSTELESEGLRVSRNQVK